jgi:hypothetical protein
MGEDMGRHVLRRLLVVLAVLAVLPVEVAHAEDVQPTVTLDPIGDTIYRGDYEHFTAHVANGHQFGVTFQQSFDGTTWTGYSGSSQSGGDPNTWFGGTQVTGSVPLGTRWIRAYTFPTAGFLEAWSAPQQQDVLIHESSISEVKAFNPDWPAILPNSPTVRVYATGVRGTPLLEQLVDGDWHDLGAGSSGGSTWVDLGPLGEGEHTFRARIPDSDFVVGSTEELVVHVTKAATEPSWFQPPTVQANHALPAQVAVNGQGGGVSFDAAMTVTEVGGTFSASGQVGMQFTIPPLSLGTHSFLVSYAGNADYEASSKTFTLTAVPDVVEATGVGLDAATFYPVVDGYRDVVHARGTRQEPASVSVAVYNAGGTRVRLLAVSRAAGAYSVAWNGRNTAGTLQPSGGYKVVQTLTDAAGTKKAVTSYVTLSRKKIYAYTTYLNKTTPTKKSTSWAGWQFTLPSATLYRALTFQVYGHSVNVPGADLGGWDVRRCAWAAPWSPDCVGSWGAIGFSTAWYSRGLSVTYNRSGRYVRAFAATSYGSGVVYKVRLKVTYGILK